MRRAKRAASAEKVEIAIYLKCTKHAISTWKFPGGQETSRMAFLEDSWQDIQIRQPGKKQVTCILPGSFQVYANFQICGNRSGCETTSDLSNSKLPGSLLEGSCFQIPSCKLPGSLLFDRSDVVSHPLRFLQIWKFAHTWKLPGRMQVTCFFPGWQIWMSFQETSR